LSSCQSSIIFHLCLSWALIFREKKVNELSRKLYDSFSMLITNWTMTQQKKWSQSFYGSFYFLFRIFFLMEKNGLSGWILDKLLRTFWITHRKTVSVQTNHNIKLKIFIQWVCIATNMYKTNSLWLWCSIMLLCLIYFDSNSENNVYFVKVLSIFLFLAMKTFSERYLR
jgi:hypothetical protein